MKSDAATLWHARRQQARPLSPSRLARGEVRIGAAPKPSGLEVAST